MRAEIIGVGTELLLGHTINSDAAHVARELAALGIELAHMQVVGDNASRLVEALELAASRSDVIITTGGLGPTGDDLTKETVARFAGLPLVEDKESLAMLMEYFGERKMTPNQLKQACLPAGSTAFANDVGTAPGCAVPLGNNKFAILLPGPPAELLPMLKKQVVPWLAAQEHACIHSTIVRTFGIGEGAAAHRLGDLLSGTNPTAATYAGDGEMLVKVTAKAPDREEAERLCAPVVAEICKKLGDVVYGLDVSSLENLVVRELASQNKTIATAESCTGGLLAKRITDEPGASAVFGLGLVTYANEAKEKLLAVPPEILEKYGAVSPQVAEIMARNVRELAGSDYGAGITGIAGPEGGSQEKPVGLVYIALAHKDGIWQRVMRPSGRYPGRQWIRRRASGHALDLLRRHLEGISPESEKE